MGGSNQFGSMNRREFIKISSVALGGIILTGCGSGGGSKYPPPTNFPNGYQFFRVKNNNAQMASQSSPFQIDKFYGSAHISSGGVVTFDAVDSNRRKAIFQLGIDFEGSRPSIEWERCSLLTGDTLADDRVVSTYKAYDVDEDGNIAAVVDADLQQSENHYGSGLYIDIDRNGFEPLLTAGQGFNGGDAISSGIFGDVSISNLNIVTAANHLPPQGSTETHKNSLIYVPNATVSNSNLLTSAGDIIMGTEHKVDSFGLIDHNASGDYSVGIFADHSDPDLLGASQGKSVFNVSGNVNYPRDLQLMTASPGVQSSDLFIPGEGGYGTRVSPAGEVYAVLDDGEGMILAQDDQVILSTGDETDQGKLLGISTGSVGPDGIYYYTALTEKVDETSMTLYAFDGAEHTALISSGDVLSDGGAPVAQILLGTTTKHIDDENRLVFFCSFMDGTTSLVVGLPS